MASREQIELKAKEQIGEDEEILATLHGNYRFNGKSAYFAVMIATDKKVVFYSKAILSEKCEIFPYQNINTVEYGKNFLTGNNVTLNTSSTEINLVRAKEPEKFTTTVRDNIGKKTAAADPTQPDIPGQIKKLADLKEKGILSDQEFTKKKQELLARL